MTTPVICITSNCRPERRTKLRPSADDWLGQRRLVDVAREPGVGVAAQLQHRWIQLDPGDGRRVHLVATYISWPPPGPMTSTSPAGLSSMASS